MASVVLASFFLWAAAVSQAAASGHSGRGGAVPGVHAHGTPHAHGVKAHPVKTIPADAPHPPAVKMRLVRDAHDPSGVNLFLEVKNFRFVPQEVNKTSKVHEGHAHLYVNGKKRTRLYGRAYFLQGLPRGLVKIRVTLNTNKHEDLRHRGKLIQDAAEFHNMADKRL